MTGRITPVLLCGGSGIRLWPLSRPGLPKQLLPLTANETMLQLTALRMSAGELFNPPVIVAGAELAETIDGQCSEAGIDAFTLILEPAPRNTAAAIALAALGCAADALLLIMPSDHIIADVAAFRAAVAIAAPIASQGWLTTFGIPPDRPETGYGYIKRGAAIASGVFAADRFVEKPELSTAEALLAEGGHYWNAGIFLFQAGSFLEALTVHAPDIAKAARSAMHRARKEGEKRLYPDAVAFQRSPARSIDHAVMEHETRIAVVPVAMHWSDVGSWDSLYDLAPKDEGGNVLNGDVAALDSINCLIRSDGPAIVTIGVENLLVVATAEGVVVARRGESQRVREAVEQLASRRLDPRV